MKIKMSDLDIVKTENNGIKGSFKVNNYNNLLVNYDYENGVLSFECGSEKKEKTNTFSKWQLHEETTYTTLLLNYLNELKKIEEIFSFEGEIIEENSVILPDLPNLHTYMVKIQYKEIHTDVKWTFFTKTGDFRLLYPLSIPINSKVICENYINDVLEYETIQRLWEPFRSKTKYRLELLHMLR